MQLKLSKPAMVSVAVAAAIAAALVPISRQTAGASTSACGTPCTSPYNMSDGTGEALTVSGTSVDMATASTTNTAQDWTVEYEQTVSTLVSDGLVSNRFMINYSNSPVYQFEYAPGGTPKNLCLADVASDAPVNDYGPPYYMPTLQVTLSQCGTTTATLWAADWNNGQDGAPTDLINLGYEAQTTFLAPTSSNFGQLTSQYSEPAVLTVSGNSVALAPLAEIGGVVPATQQWGDFLSSVALQVTKNAMSKSGTSS
jgi:hypothetical protein